jgi:hypothetical protein
MTDMNLTIRIQHNTVYYLTWILHPQEESTALREICPAVINNQCDVVTRTSHSSSDANTIDIRVDADTISICGQEDTFDIRCA